MSESEPKPAKPPGIPFKVGPIKSIRSTRRMLVRLLDAVATGKIEVNMANCMGQLAAHLTRCLELETIETRVNELSKDLKEIPDTRTRDRYGNRVN